MDYEGHWLYKEICSMSKEFRYSIGHMPVEYRYEIGRDIRAILRELKYKAYKAIKFSSILSCQDKDILIDLLNKLKIWVDECLEDKLLLVTGKYTIIQPRKRLKELLERLGTTGSSQQ